LINTIVVARSFIYFSELDLQRRSDDMSKWIRKKKITPSNSCGLMLYISFDNRMTVVISKKSMYFTIIDKYVPKT
jgi:hypothetical protein